MSVLTFSVPAMKCQGCVATISDALASAQSKNKEIKQFSVDLENKTVSVDSTLSTDSVISIIKTVGFEATLTN